MKITFVTVLQVLCFYCRDVELKTFNPSSSSELRSAIEEATAGDVISLYPKDYEGDFVLKKSGAKGNPIVLIGTSEENKNTKIIANHKAIYLQANYWTIQNMEIQGGEFSVFVEGSHNLLSSLAIHDVNKAVLIKGSDNTAKELAIRSKNTGITVEKGDGNKIMSNSVSMNSASLNIFENTCCGLIESNTLQGPMQMNGNKYILSSNVANGGVNMKGCNNELSSNLFSNVYFTKSCKNNDAGLNMYRGVVDKLQNFNIEKTGSEAESSATKNKLAIVVMFIVNALFFTYSSVIR